MGYRGVYEPVREKKNRLYDADKDNEPGSQPVYESFRRKETAALDPAGLDGRGAHHDSHFAQDLHNCSHNAAIHAYRRAGSGRCLFGRKIDHHVRDFFIRGESLE